MRENESKLNGKIIVIVKEISEKVSVVALAMITIVLFSQIVLRNFTAKGLVWGNELSIYFNLWLVFLGATIIFADKKHVSMDFVMSRLSPKVNRIVDLFNQLLIIVFVACVLYQSVVFLLKNTGKTPVMGLPYLWFYLPLVISMVFMSLLAVIQLIELLREEK